MRERLARLLAIGIVLLAIALAALYARRGGPTDADAPAPGASPGPVAADPVAAAPTTAGRAPGDPAVALGATLFTARGCQRCHALGGVGNPALPLDGVGARLPPERLRAAILADGEAGAAMPPRIRAKKQEYRALPAAEIDALVAALAASRGATGVPR